MVKVYRKALNSWSTCLKFKKTKWKVSNFYNGIRNLCEIMA